MDLLYCSKRTYSQIENDWKANGCDDQKYVYRENSIVLQVFKNMLEFAKCKWLIFGRKSQKIQIQD